jgi:perosamine synthetase
LEHTTGGENCYWVFGLVLPIAAAFDGREMMRRLASRGVGTRPFFWPINRQPVFLKMGLFQDVSCPIAERIAKQGFYIPSGLALTEEQILEVSTAVKESLL